MGNRTKQPTFNFTLAELLIALVIMVEIANSAGFTGTTTTDPSW